MQLFAKIYAFLESGNRETSILENLKTKNQKSHHQLCFRTNWKNGEVHETSLISTKKHTCRLKHDCNRKTCENAWICINSCITCCTAWRLSKSFLRALGCKSSIPESKLYKVIECICSYFCIEIYVFLDSGFRETTMLANWEWSSKVSHQQCLYT